ncbi:MAG TPA: HigA family addiction module antitoxin [Bacteroidales bacterium]|nr:HigA family addiction module antitoxin [Bacteroidales bacterium]
MGSYKVVGKDGREIRSDVIMHPGEVLDEELKARNIVKSVFAMEIKAYPSHFSEILRGKRNINASLAIKLEKALGISAEFWIRLQGEYDVAMERKKLEAV